MDEPKSGPSARPAGRSRRRRRWLVLVPLATLALVLYFIRLPYFVLSPGPAEDVEPLIHLTGPGTYPSHGRLLLTAIEFRSTNIYGLVRGWADPTESVVPQADILGPGQSEAQEARVAISEMDTSKIDAAVVALSRFAGYPRRHRPGALVEEVFPNTPAEGELFAGDLVTAVDGTPVHGPEDLGMRIRRAGPGTPLHLTVQGRPGGVTHVTVAPAVIRVQGTDHVVIGVVLVRNFPFPLTIESGEIGGPSAGLMWTLGLIDLLTPGDLTRGRTIAGTGAIDLRGRVYPIGGVEEKVVAAERAGARIFFAPVQDAPAARRVAHGITVVPVRTYLDALAYLLNRPPLPPRARTNSLG